MDMVLLLLVLVNVASAQSACKRCERFWHRCSNRCDNMEGYIEHYVVSC